MTSTFPSLSRFLYSAGVFGLLTSHGSMTITLPLGVVIFVVACPSQWISVLALWAHVVSAASVSVAAALALRNSRRSMSRASCGWRLLYHRGRSALRPLVVSATVCASLTPRVLERA